MVSSHLKEKFTILKKLRSKKLYSIPKYIAATVKFMGIELLTKIY